MVTHFKESQLKKITYKGRKWRIIAECCVFLGIFQIPRDYNAGWFPLLRYYKEQFKVSFLKPLALCRYL